MFMSEQYNNMFKNNNIHIMKERNRERWYFLKICYR
jgi:hypothetical protein